MNSPTLFAITSPVVDMTPEESIVYMARVSSPNQTIDNPEKLLHYLVQHGHWSPFDMVDMTCEIHTSRAIMAQILRHWSFRFQEFSQRYAAVPESVTWDHVEVREKLAGGNRQSSGPVSAARSRDMQKTCEHLQDEYEEWLSQGVAPECARMILPLATPTRAYMKGSVRSWMTYFWQRLDPHAQKEHRELAEELFVIFSQQFPTIASLVRTYKPGLIPLT